MNKPRILRLNLKAVYFHQIAAGTKTHEYRLASTWERRLTGRTYDEIHLLLGYPKNSDESRVLRRAWNGFRVETITHPHFGAAEVRVLAIDVTRPCASNAHLQTERSHQSARS